MKKFVFAAAMTAAIVSTNAHAESFSESCGHIDNPTRFNPTELSEYQECWLDFHKADEAAGVLGSIFFARVGDEFVSMPVSELREAGSKSAAKAIVVDRIVEVVNNERIEELEGVVASLEATVSEKEAAIRALEMLRDSQAGTIAGLNTQISTLEDEKAALETARAALQATIDGHPAVVRAAEEAARMAGVLSVTVGTGDVSASWTAETVTIALSNGSSYEYSIAQGASVYRAEGRGDILSQIRDTDNTRTEGVSATLDLNGNISIQFEAGYGEIAPAIAAARTTALAGYTLDVTGNTELDSAVSGATAESRVCVSDCEGFALFGLQYTFTVNSTDISGAADTLRLVAINNTMEAVFDHAFDAGYDEGYADGYADGFRDGVNSVR